MPRDGSKIYTQPFPDVEEDTTIESAVYNGFVSDISIDLNNPRPVLSGGTGASNARDAMVNLNGETAKQLVTNYTAHAWLPGSFYSTAATGQGAPVDGHAFAGLCYLSDDQNIIIEARDQNDTVVPGRLYVREKKLGAWTAAGWVSDTKVLEDTKVNRAGDIMTGPLGINHASPYLLLNKTAGDTNGNYVAGATATKNRWAMMLGDGAVEGADLVGSNFNLYRYNNAGAAIDAPISISRQTGTVLINGQEKMSKGGDTMTGPLNVPAPTADTHAANKYYVDHAPRKVTVHSAYQHYYLTMADAGSIVGMAVPGVESWFVIQTEAIRGWVYGTQIDLVHWGSPIVRVYPEGAVGLLSEDSRRRLRSTWATATIFYAGGNNWILTGSLIP